MRLIEKKCPNCGANLEFNETDKSCHCKYCNRDFEIERDLNDVEKFNLIYDKIHKPFNALVFIPFIFAFLIIVFVSIGMIFSFDNSKKDNNSNNFVKDKIDEIFDDIKEEEKLLTDVSELSNRDFDSIDNHATTEINHTGEGVNNATHSYSIDGNITREKLYVAYKTDSNYIIAIYKATYRDFFHQEDRHTVYIPIVFENIKKNVTFSLGNATLKAPEYYFNAEHTSFTHGYGSFEEAYQKVVEPLKDEYNISEK